MDRIAGFGPVDGGSIPPGLVFVRSDFGPVDCSQNAFRNEFLHCFSVARSVLLGVRVPSVRYLINFNFNDRIKIIRQAVKFAPVTSSTSKFLIKNKEY